VSKLAPKVRHREATRERKAEAAAKIERTIERELLERLRSGVYGDKPLNCSEDIWKKVLKAMGTLFAPRSLRLFLALFGFMSQALTRGATEREGEAVRDVDLDEGIVEEDSDKEAVSEDENELVGETVYVSDLEESEEEANDIEDWLAEDDDDVEEDDQSEESDEEKGKSKAGDKRKRGRVTRMKARKKKEVEAENEKAVLLI